MQAQLFQEHVLQPALPEPCETGEIFPFLTWWSDCDGERCRFGHAWEPFAGQKALRPFDWLAKIHPHDRAPLRRTFARAFQLRQPHQAEYRFRRADGAYRWLLEQATPAHGADGSFRGYQGLCVDITERKFAEKSLLESEQRFRRSFDTPLAGMILASPDKVFVEVNDALCEMLGYKREELVGKTWLDFTHPDDVGQNADLLADVLAGRSEGYLLEKRYRRKDGRTVHAVISARAVRDDRGRLQHLVTMIQDVTVKRETERIMQAIVESTSGMTGEGFFRSLVQSLAQALNTRYAFIGRLREPDTVETVSVWADESIAPNFSYPLAGTPCEQLIEHREARSYPQGVRNRFPEDPMLVELGVECYAGAPLFDSAGKPLGVIGVLDAGILPNPGKAEQLLRVFATRAGAELERKRSEELLLAAKAEAERANNAKSRFLAAASHDLRQPLSALALYLDVFKSKAAPADAKLVDNMKDCVGSLGELLTDLLDLSKLEAGVVQPNVTDFAIDDLLSALVSVHAPEAELKGLSLRCVGSRQVARTDQVLFRRMLGNLLSNALRYTEAGGVLIGCRRRGGTTWVEVWDTGIGIPAESLDEIFEEFKQLGDPGRTRGSGLGLAIVAKSAALLGLRIRVESRPGRGSMFALEMPAGKRSKKPARNRSRPHALRIALIEDNAQLRQALELALSCVGHELVAASNGAEIHARLAGRAPDLVISDYRLAEVQTGYEVIASLRAVFGDEVPAILITGDTDPQLLRVMADRGIVVQHKPLDVDALQTCIHALMDEGAACERRTAVKAA